MSDSEPDFMDDSFLNPPEPSTKMSKSSQLSYSQRRKQALRASEAKNAAHRVPSRREREEEQRREGLETSLFERAKLEEAARKKEREQEGKREGEAGGEEEADGGNKALRMMMKMGFKMGGTLGKERKAPEEDSAEGGGEREGTSTPVEKARAEPIKPEIWERRTGIGARKRPATLSSSDISELAAKAAKRDRDVAEDFRARARVEFEGKRAEGRLGNARRTLQDLDAKHEVEYNVLHIDPRNPDTYPSFLTDESAEPLDLPAIAADNASAAERLRAEMQRDALSRLEDDQEAEEDQEEEPRRMGLGAAKKREEAASALADGEIRIEDVDDDNAEETPKQRKKREAALRKEAVDFISLDAPTRLQLTLTHLRAEYCYCFWCGTQYDDREDMDKNCPGPDEDDHE